MAGHSDESAFRRPGAVAFPQCLIKDKWMVHPPMFRKHEGGFTQCWFEDGERRGRTVRCLI